MLLLAVLQRNRAHWQGIPEPSATLSSVVTFFNAFLQARAENRVVVVSGAVVFDSERDALGDFVRDLQHVEDVPLSSDLGHALCLANAWAPAGDARIFVVSFETDRGVMRCLFGAQKLGIRIDAVSFDDSDVVKQAAVVTGGLYWHGEALDAFFLKTLGSEREAQPIGFRTACLCHGRPVLYGLVCPVCLAVYCRVVPVCRKCRIKIDF